MKIFITTCLLCFSYINANAQATAAYPRDVAEKTVIDNSTLTITYKARISADTIGRRFYCDNQVLAVGKKYKRYYSKFAEDIDSAKYKFDKGIIKSPYGDEFFDKFIVLVKNQDADYEDIFTDFPEKGVNTVYNIFDDVAYVYKESTPVFNWTITGAKDTVLGYECQEARTRFRGREYVAWFTLDIPISAGPWKLNGLPGLILKAQDTRGLFQYTAIGMEQQEKPLYMYEIKAQKCTRKDILKFNDLRWKDFQLLAKIMGGHEVAMFEDGKLVDNKTHIVEYIPQHELE